jgi:NAD-dependent SIR2 family protein deacetylase
MNANPSMCAHRNMTYDGTFRIVRCMDCDTTWDADEPIPSHARSASANTCDECGERSEAAHIKQPTNINLNPDNDANSEHMQYKDNEHEDTA